MKTWQDNAALLRQRGWNRQTIAWNLDGTYTVTVEFVVDIEPGTGKVLSEVTESGPTLREAYRKLKRSTSV